MFLFPKDTRKAGFLFGLCCLLAFASFTPTQAQSTRDLNNRIKRLENEIQTLNKAVYRGETPPPSFSDNVANPAATEVRIQELETSIRNLTGQIEEQNFKVRQMQTQLERLSGDMNLRLQDLESRARPPSPSGAIMPQTNNPDGYQWNSGANSAVEINPDVVGQADGPSALYNRAFSLLKQEKYANSQVMFEQFLSAHPDHKLAGNAIYWLGETHYVRGEYGDAAQIFAQAYQKYPNSAKAPDNVLKLGMSLAGAGKKDEACIALKQVEVEHSDSGPVLRRAKQELSKLGC